MIDPKKYDYTLPQELIAQEPATPRDSSKLFVYNTTTNTVSIDRFYNLEKYLPKESLVILNRTKVLPSRIVLYKENGGRVKTLFLVNEIHNFIVKAMLDRGVKIGQSLHFDQETLFTVISQDEHVFTLKIDFPVKKFISLLEKHGSMPIPPYLKHSNLTEKQLRKKYQTVFAKDKGSAAAPTASLHFTNRVFKKLENKNIKKVYVKLHVGAGTFAPLLEKNLKEEKLHEEFYEVSEKAAKVITAAKKKHQKIIAVGTTVVRTLESAAISKNVVEAQSGETEIFIFPPYDFKMVDILLTNFHVPKSSLMMLVDAFLRHKKSKKSVQELYSIAIKEKLRFFSFGDAMLII